MMRHNRWKAPIILAGVVLLFGRCQGQGSSNGGANFFYYYSSPTQRTQVNTHDNYGQVAHGGGSPFLNQAASQAPLLSYTTAPPHQQYVYQTPASTASFDQSRFQLPFQQHQPLVTSAPSPSFVTFSNPHSHLSQGFLNPYQTGSAQTQVQASQGYSFFESPFQYLQQRYLTTPPAQEVAPTQAPPQDSEPNARKPKFSSTFRFVEQPASPYSRLSGFTSDSPFTVRRFYNTELPSAPTPTGYAFSIGGDGTSKASVHVSMGPLTSSQRQHLTEITGSRLFQRPQQFSAVIPSRQALGLVPTEISTEAPAPTSAPPSEASTSTTSAPSTPEVEPPKEESPPQAEVPTNPLQSTVETLIKEPSFQTKTIASPKPELSRKLNEANMRVVIRRRQRPSAILANGDLTSSEEKPQGRSISPINQLPEEIKEHNVFQKGDTPILVSSSTPVTSLTSEPPISEAPVSSSTATSSVAEPPNPFDAVPPPNPPHEEYYDYNEGQGGQANAKPAQQSEESLPVAPGLRPEDFPGVFHPEGENSVETDQGQTITRYKSSRPTEGTGSGFISIPSVSTEPSVEVPQKPAVIEEEPHPMSPSPLPSTSTEQAASTSSSTTESVLEGIAHDASPNATTSSHVEEGRDHLESTTPTVSSTSEISISSTAASLEDRASSAAPEDNIEEETTSPPAESLSSSSEPPAGQQSSSDAGMESENVSTSTTSLPPTTSNTTTITPEIISTGSRGGRRRSRNFNRKELQLANLTLPTSGPIQNINAVLEDGDGDTRSQVIQKIQRFRSSARRGTSTTTKRPRRVTRPSSRTVLEQVDSFSDSSYAGVETPLSIPTTIPTTKTTTTPKPARYGITYSPPQESSTLAVTPTTDLSESFPPPTTMKATTTEDAATLLNLLMPTEETTYSTTAIFATSRTTTTMTTSTTVDQEDYDDLLHDKGDDQVDDPSSVDNDDGNTTPFSSSTERVHTTSERIKSTSPLTTTPSSSTTTPQPKSAGSLIIHEILPTQPPLKEVSFVIGESVEDDLVLQSGESSLKKSNVTSAALVRVESNVQVSSSVAQGTSSEEREGVVMTMPNGKKVRVVVKKQRKVGGKSGNAPPPRFTIS